jgi:hypothetical protein
MHLVYVVICTKLAKLEGYIAYSAVEREKNRMAMVVETYQRGESLCPFPSSYPLLYLYSSSHPLPNVCCCLAAEGMMKIGGYGAEHLRAGKKQLEGLSGGEMVLE